MREPTTRISSHPGHGRLARVRDTRVVLDRVRPQNVAQDALHARLLESIDLVEARQRVSVLWRSQVVDRTTQSHLFDICQCLHVGSEPAMDAQEAGVEERRDGEGAE
jgi:hypothetical protein